MFLSPFFVFGFFSSLVNGSQIAFAASVYFGGKATGYFFSFWIIGLFYNPILNNLLGIWLVNLEPMWWRYRSKHTGGQGQISIDICLFFPDRHRPLFYHPDIAYIHFFSCIYSLVQVQAVVQGLEVGLDYSDFALASLVQFIPSCPGLDWIQDSSFDF